MPSTYWTLRCFIYGSSVGAVLLELPTTTTSPPALMKGRKDVEAKGSESAGNLHGAQKTAPGSASGALHWRIQTSGSRGRHHFLSNNSRQYPYLASLRWGQRGLRARRPSYGDKEGLFLPVFQFLLTNWGKKSTNTQLIIPFHFSEKPGCL